MKQIRPLLIIFALLFALTATFSLTQAQDTSGTLPDTVVQTAPAAHTLSAKDSTILSDVVVSAKALNVPVDSITSPQQILHAALKLAAEAKAASNATGQNAIVAWIGFVLGLLRVIIALIVYVAHTGTKKLLADTIASIEGKNL